MTSARAVEAFELQRYHGRNLAVTMGNTLFKSLETAALELICNAYDADATEVQVTYDPELNVFSVGDNGEGMDRQGLESFFRMGDSMKIANPISPKGRRRIGHFGIASLAVRALGQEHRLDAYKEGQHYTMREKFSHDDKDDASIRVDVEPSDPRRHGVTITLGRLNFSEREGRFSLHRLCEQISHELPIDFDGFNVYVNKQPIRPVTLRGRITEYVLDIDDKLAGPIRGSIFYSRLKLGKDAGLYIKVNGRGVGGSNHERYANNLGVSLLPRVYGVLRVDDMADEVLFDRAKFRDGPRIKSLDRHVREVLKQIRQDMEGEVIDSKQQKAAELLREILPEAGRTVGKLMNDRPYGFVFDQRKAGDLVYVDRKERKVYVNPSAAPLALSGLSSADIRVAIGHIIEYAVLSTLLEDDPEKQEQFEDAVLQLNEQLMAAKPHKARRTLAEILRDQRTEDDEAFNPSLRISPNRLYELREVTQRTGFANPILKRMIESGVVADRGSERVLGTDVVTIKVDMHDRAFLYDVVRDVPVPEGRADFAFYQQKERDAIPRLDRRTEQGTLPRYVHNAAPAGRQSFYVVDSKHRDKLAGFIKDWKFPEDKETRF